MNIFQPHTITYLIGVGGGCLLIFGSVSASARNLSALLRTVVWFGGSLAVCWGLLGLTYFYGYYHLSAGVRVRVLQGKTLCSGGALALLFLLLSSKEFWKANRSAWLQRRAAMYPSSPDSVS